MNESFPVHETCFKAHQIIRSNADWLQNPPFNPSIDARAEDLQAARHAVISAVDSRPESCQLQWEDVKSLGCGVCIFAVQIPNIGRRALS